MLARHRRLRVLVVGVAGTLTAAALVSPRAPHSATEPDPPAGMRAQRHAASLQIPFIERSNDGRADAVAFHAPIAGGSVAVTRAGEIVYAFRRPRPAPPAVITETLVGATIAGVRG